MQVKLKQVNAPQQKITEQVNKVAIQPVPNRRDGGINSNLKSFSLKNLAQKVQQPVNYQQKKEKKQVVEEPIDLSWNETFDQEKLDEVWRQYTRQHETYPRIHTIFKNHQPQMVDKSTLLIKLRNKTQEHELVKERPNILSYLRKSLKNAHILLNLEVAIGEDCGPKKAFTVADKYKAMSEKNPVLTQFKKEFNLDLE